MSFKRPSNKISSVIAFLAATLVNVLLTLLKSCCKKLNSRLILGKGIVCKFSIYIVFVFILQQIFYLCLWEGIILSFILSTVNVGNALKALQMWSNYLWDEYIWEKFQNFKDVATLQIKHISSIFPFLFFSFSKLYCSLHQLNNL